MIVRVIACLSSSHEGLVLRLPPSLSLPCIRIVRDLGGHSVEVDGSDNLLTILILFHLIHALSVRSHSLLMVQSVLMRVIQVLLMLIVVAVTTMTDAFLIEGPQRLCV